jgi:hypothetical protein
MRTTFEGKYTDGSAYYILHKALQMNIPLFDRGWVLQEEILSSRGLDFGNELSWRCICHESSESRPEPRESVQDFQEIGKTQWDRWRE